MLFLATLTLQDHGRPLASAAFAVVVWVLVALAAFGRAPRHVRFGVATVIATLVVGLGGITVAAAADLQEAYDATRRAQDELRRGYASAKEGDFDSVQGAINRATTHVADARSSFDSPFVNALRHAPIAGPNLHVVADLLNPANDLANSARRATDAAQDLDELWTSDGVSLEKISTIGAHSDSLLEDARVLRSTVDRQLGEESSIWLAPQLIEQLHTVVARTETLDEVADISIRSVVERLLGSGEPRTYLLLLGNTAEARELGGFTGGTALVSVQDGAVSLVRADRPIALNENPSSPRVLSMPVPQRFLDHRPWDYSQNYTAMADFPSLAHALGDLYPAMGGAEVDGVAYMDPTAVAAFVAMVGEVDLPVANTSMTADEVVRFINVEQYERFDERADREDFLSELMTATFQSIVGSTSDLDLSNASAIVEAVRQDRILFVPFDDAEFTIMETLGVVGGIPNIEGQDYLAVSTLNAGPNKLDTYLHRTVSYEASVDPRTGELTAVVEVTLRNDAPPDLPRYARYNQLGLPDATNRAVVVVHTPHDVVDRTGGNEPAMERSFREFGLQRHETVVHVPRGGSRTVTFMLSGTVVAGEEYRLHLGHQPLVNNDAVSLMIEPTIAGTAGAIQKEIVLTADRQFSTTWTRPEAPS